MSTPIDENAIPPVVINQESIASLLRGLTIRSRECGNKSAHVLECFTVGIANILQGKQAYSYSHLANILEAIAESPPSAVDISRAKQALESAMNSLKGLGAEEVLQRLDASAKFIQESVLKFPAGSHMQSMCGGADSARGLLIYDILDALQPANSALVDAAKNRLIGQSEGFAVQSRK